MDTRAVVHPSSTISRVETCTHVVLVELLLLLLEGASARDLLLLVLWR
jgi:hypothetical protein